MESISIVLPTWKRPTALYEFLMSIESNTKNKHRIEVCIYFDKDDLETIEHLERIKQIFSFKILSYLGEVGAHKKYQCGWDIAYKNLSNNSIIMMAADDFRFRKKNNTYWDDIVFEEFDKCSDKIMLLYGDDGFVSKNLEIPTFHFIHKKWIDALPFWCPPYFTFDYADTWQGDIAKLLNRKVYRDDLFIEHMHYLIKKSQFDPIAYERYLEEKKNETNKRLYYSKEKQEERQKFANILQRLIRI